MNDNDEMSTVESTIFKIKTRFEGQIAKHVMEEKHFKFSKIMFDPTQNTRWFWLSVFCNCRKQFNIKIKDNIKNIELQEIHIKKELIDTSLFEDTWRYTSVYNNKRYATFANYSNMMLKHININECHNYAFLEILDEINRDFGLIIPKIFEIKLKKY